MQMSHYEKLEETTPVVNHHEQSPFQQYVVQYEINLWFKPYINRW
jgi:hypothetical protein